jgi:hypothetical protein
MFMVVHLIVCFCLVYYFSILADGFLSFATFSLYPFFCARRNGAVSKQMDGAYRQTKTVTKHPFPAGYNLEMLCELEEKSFSMGTNLQWKLYHFDDDCCCRVDAASISVSMWDMQAARAALSLCRHPLQLLLCTGTCVR